MKSKSGSRCRSWIAGALMLALAMVMIPTRAKAAGLLIADGGFGGVLEIQQHDVRVTINNGIAVTEVTQVFHNTENRAVEALYTFPVPKGASVSNFSMWINGTEMIGEVLEKEKAREIYNSYKQQPRPRDPGLLEQTDYRTFEMRVFPIAPNADQRVQITYCQELDFDSDWATYVYPLATSTRQGLDTRTTGRFSIHADVKSEIPIVAMESPSHTSDFVIANRSENYSEASLEATGGDLGRDVVLAFHVARPRTGIDVITSKENGQDGYFALTLTAGEELPQHNAQMDYVFVLDISGSMQNDRKLDISRGSVNAFVNSFSPNDRFEIITFNVQSTTAFGQLRQADDTARADAAQFLQTQQARGGTVLEPALQAAYRYADPERPLNVVILSDGMTEQRERAQLLQLIPKRPNQSRVFCVGVGNDVNRALLEQLANDSGGLAAFVSSDDNLQRQAEAFRRKLLRPVATELAINISGVDVYDLEPKTLPNLYHGMPVRLYGRYKGNGDANVKVTGNVLGNPISQSVPITLPRRDDANPQIERMWAWHRVDRLMKESEANGSRSSVVDQIVRLGEGYSIVTEYTSFIVLENDGEYQRWKIDRKNQLRTQRDRGAERRLAEQLEQMRNDAAAAIGPAPASPVQLAIAPNSNTNAPQTTAAPAPSAPNRSRDINWGGGGGGGGGAMSPADVCAAIALVGLVLISMAGVKRAKVQP